MELKQQVLRGWCQEMTKAMDYKADELFQHCVDKIVEILNALTREEQQAIFNADKDMRAFVESFGTFKNLVK